MTLRPNAAALLLAALSACGGTGMSEPSLLATEAAGGTRLKANWYAAPDGPVMPVPPGRGAFHDGALDLDCDFVLAGDGTWRCLPIDVLPVVVQYDRTTYFTDDRCTHQVVSAGLRCGVQASQIAMRTATCPTLERRFAVGAAIVDGTAIWSRGSYGRCVPETYFRASAFHELGAEADYAAYAGAARRDGETRGGFTEVALAGTDGALLPLGVRAASAAELLAPLPAADGAAHLLPAWDARTWFDEDWADATCGTPAASLPGRCTSVPARATDLGATDDGCHDAFRVRELGPVLDAPFGYDDGSTTCGPLAGDPERTAVRLGSELPASAFAPAPAVSAASVGRLRRSAVRVGDWRWPWEVVTDTALAARVWPMHDSDGSLRWLPDTLAVSIQSARWFADGECKIPLAELSGTLCAPAPRLVLFYTVCPPTYVVAPLVPFQPSSGVYTNQFGAGGCWPASGPLGPFGSLYVAGTPISPEAFLQVTVVRR